MLVLLPPSEGKAGGGDCPPVDLAGLSFPELSATRATVGRVLVALCRGRPARAREVLGLSPALDAERAADAQLWEAPTLPVGQRYRGVLYDALGYPALPSAARRRADASLLVFSGLWGALRPTDRIPAYRLGIATRLPRRPALPVLWREPLHVALDELVVAHGAIDLRSAGYSQMYRPSPAAARRLVAVRVTGPDGARAAPSFAGKQAKGRLVREMLRRGQPGVEALLRAADRLELPAERTGSGIVVRVPPADPAG